MKNIKLQAVVHPEFGKVLVKVTAQTHRGNGFGNSYGGKKFRASNGIVLGSNRRPARDEADANTIWLRGSIGAKDDTTLVMTKAKFEKLAAAVKEYNAYYAALVAAPRPAAADRCSYIVG